MPGRRLALVRAALLLLSSLVGLVLVEFGLRWTGEARPAAPDYGDVFDGTLREGGQLRPDFDGAVRDGRGGTVRWVTNAAGFRNTTDFERRVAPSRLRVLSLGDSFAAGYRVGQEDTYSRRLEVALDARFPGIEVAIAVAGDPGDALRYLERFGHDLAPDLILLTLTLGNDIVQTHAGAQRPPLRFKGDLDAFVLPESALRPAAGLGRAGLRFRRWLERLAIVSRLSDPPGIVSWYGRFEKRKLFDPANGLGMFLAEPHPEIDAAYATFATVLRGIASWAREADVGLMLAVAPQRFQIQPEDWQAAVRDYELREDAFDLDRPNRFLSEFAARADVAIVDPTSALRAAAAESGASLYLPRRDMHWNEAGHRAFAAAILEPVARALGRSAR